MRGPHENNGFCFHGQFETLLLRAIQWELSTTFARFDLETCKRTATRKVARGSRPALSSQNSRDIFFTAERFTSKAMGGEGRGETIEMIQ